jgi:hypothetical protein
VMGEMDVHMAQQRKPEEEEEEKRREAPSR